MPTGPGPERLGRPAITAVSVGSGAVSQLRKTPMALRPAPPLCASRSRWAESGCSLQLAPASGSVVGDDLLEHRAEREKYVDVVLRRHDRSLAGLELAAASRDPRYSTVTSIMGQNDTSEITRVPYPRAFLALPD